MIKTEINILMARQGNYGRDWAWRKGDCGRYQKQAEEIAFVYRSQFTSEPAEKLAKKLSDLSVGDLNWSFL